MKRLLYLILIFPVILLIGCTNSDLSQEAHYQTETTPTPEPTTEPTLAPTPEPAPELTPEPTPEPTPEATPEPRPSFGFIDAHADTISRALLRDPAQQSLYINNTLDVDFSRLSEFDAPVQVFALWLSDRFVETGFEQTNRQIDFFEEQVALHSDLIEIALDLDDIRRIAREGRISAVLSIEGGEALMGDIDNLDHFFNRGVRIFAPVWNRENELGFGQATDSTEGLTDFGIEVIKRMDELGMILDVSHLNEAGFWDAHNASTRPYMASHSNAYAVMPHNRNLRDDQIMAMIERGGIIGFNMFPQIVAPGDVVTMDEVLAHFHHFIQIGAVNYIGLGCDFDGIPSMPQGIYCVSSLHVFNEILANEFGEYIAFRIMEGNFYDFFVRFFEG